MKELDCNSAILSVGYKPESSLYEQLKFDVSEICLLGDAKMWQTLRPLIISNTALHNRL